MKIIVHRKGFGAQRRSGRRAYALVTALCLSGIFGILMSSLLSSTVTQRKLSDRYQLYTEEFSIAEFQLNKAIAEITYAMKKAGERDPDKVVQAVAAANVPGYEVKSFEITRLPANIGEDPDFPGYAMEQALFRIAVEVKRDDAWGQRYEHPGVGLQQNLRITYVPLCAYGIFSDVDLEIHPGADFIETGRVHSNGNLYYGADGKKMDFRDYVSAAGNIIYGRHKDSGKGLGQGTNSFWNGTRLVNSRINGINVDYLYNVGGVQWAKMALDTWRGFVKDKAHGVPDMKLPWPEQADNPATPEDESLNAADLIQPADPNDFGALLTDKFVYKAGLVVTVEPPEAGYPNGRVYALTPEGVEVPLTYRVGARTKSVYSFSTIYNERDGGETDPVNGRTGGYVRLFNLDLQNMQEAGIAPANGIVYIHDKQTSGAVRLINCTELPGNPNLGISFVTASPLYIHGDYNTVNERVSMLAGDALVILSTGWSDAANDTPTERKNAPSSSGPVVTNAVIGAGNVETFADKKNNKHYSGGIENFFRYMEKWDGTRTHTFKGSILLLFHSLLAKGTWDQQAYSAPKRNWNWNPTLKTSVPPGVPIVFKTKRENWSIKYD